VLRLVAALLVELRQTVVRQLVGLLPHSVRGVGHVRDLRLFIVPVAAATGGSGSSLHEEELVQRLQAFASRL
jgi:hypothetical protein